MISRYNEKKRNNLKFLTFSKFKHFFLCFTFSFSCKRRQQAQNLISYLFSSSLLTSVGGSSNLARSGSYLF